MTKKELVEKIAKEQNLDPKKLSRLNMEELKKMDEVVPDEDESVVIPDGSEAADEVIAFPNGSTITVGPVDEEDKLEGLNKKLVGYHPVTKEAVYR